MIQGAFTQNTVSCCMPITRFPSLDGGILAAEEYQEE